MPQGPPASRRSQRPLAAPRPEAALGGVHAPSRGAPVTTISRPVIEALLVLAGVALLALLGFLAPLVPGIWWIQAGWYAVAAGLLLGVPTGTVYHVRLARALARRGCLPSGWWLRPAALHGELEPAERARVLPWFAAGGAGFVAVVAGCLAIVSGLVSEAFRAGLLGGAGILGGAGLPGG